ncbi:protein FAR1-RELATED SEQUENCE 9-like [Silene latifolia]|uniref:protein FAR1-RELATED SEQUENCE 9-like n=1 Tax=Silene latifolia TaxID=37657 RepID=UPI003D77E428
MLLETFMQKKAMSPSFYFDFDVDDEKRLSKVFWADPISIKNYALFGEVVSFDATYNFNEYKMVFCPFRGVDNYKRCVTFAGGLLRKEDGESFTWLFENFVEAMGIKYSKVTADDKNSSPKLSIPLLLEKKTAEFYSTIVFYEFHEELQAACFTCGLSPRTTKDYNEHISIMDREKDKDIGFDDIPREYLLDRWSKCATCCPIFNVVGTTLLADLFTSVSLVEDNEELGNELLELLRSFNEKLMISVKRGKSKNKKAEIEMLIGSKTPTEASVLPPEKCKNKGSGRRITSSKEKAVQENAKPLRECRACGEMTHHDSRNCPSRVTQK